MLEIIAYLLIVSWVMCLLVGVPTGAVHLLLAGALVALMIHHRSQSRSTRRVSPASMLAFMTGVPRKGVGSQRGASSADRTAVETPPRRVRETVSPSPDLKSPAVPI